MSSKNIEIVIGHSWFGQLYLSQPSGVKLTSNGIEFTEPEGHCSARYRKSTQSATTTLVSWLQLSSPPVFLPSFLGSLLCFQVGAKSYQIPYLGYFAKSTFLHQVHRLWAQAHEQSLCGLIVRIEHAIENRYLRESIREQIQQRVKREYKRWLPSHKCD
ncbi:hypothetical protein [Shewanella youngdeokensis]|uniref:Uncharacterized protein n=1 Tax=Shewanella youngdeokensis TaxID=2999068 RepID=A0ABZ0JZB6_9GAMM|nr:hypothetical protein RGE70_16320 [Shewanella sp. DAU334]